MKQILQLGISLSLLAFSFTTQAQDDKSKRPSPPAKVSQEINTGASISIDYSQPSVKGRTIGKDLEPMEGKVWRTGANEATVFETNKDIKINGKTLPAGKYGFFSISGKDSWTIIFNKTWKQWGAYDYKQADDILRVNVKPKHADAFAEKLTFTISNKGVVGFVWGNDKVEFTAQ